MSVPSHTQARRSAVPPRVDDHLQIGAERRINVDRRNGVAVLLAGCPSCGRIAPVPARMHSEGWLIVADDIGVRFIACPEHRDNYATR